LTLRLRAGKMAEVLLVADSEAYKFPEEAPGHILKLV
jgi:hypothetical protein